MTTRPRLALAALIALAQPALAQTAADPANIFGLPGDGGAAGIESGTAVTLIDYDNPWLLVEWQSATGPQRGWLSTRWVEWTGTPPPDFPGALDN